MRSCLLRVSRRLRICGFSASAPAIVRSNPAAQAPRLYDGGREDLTMTTISPAELAGLRERGEMHALLDLRERGAYERGHIFRATALPRRLLEFRLPLLVTGRSTPLVLHDEDGVLAALAVPTLAAMG